MMVSLLSPERLLEFIRFFILFDSKSGKVAARYQQVFGIKATIKRLQVRRQSGKSGKSGGRAGGVIWHTTGSGKSFTMVFLCKALLLHPALKNCRMVVVTDRVGLEKQLSKHSSAAAPSEVRSPASRSARSPRRPQAVTSPNASVRAGSGSFSPSSINS